MKKTIVSLAILATLTIPSIAVAGALDDIADNGAELWQDHHFVEYGSFEYKSGKNALRAESGKNRWAGHWQMRLTDQNMSILLCPVQIKKNGAIPLDNCKVSLNKGASVGGPMDAVSIKVKKSGAAHLRISIAGAAISSEELYFNKQGTHAEGFVRIPSSNEILSLTMIKINKFTKMKFSAPPTRGGTGQPIAKM